MKVYITFLIVIMAVGAGVSKLPVNMTEPLASMNINITAGVESLMEWMYQIQGLVQNCTQERDQLREELNQKPSGEKDGPANPGADYWLTYTLSNSISTALGGFVSGIICVFVVHYLNREKNQKKDLHREVDSMRKEILESMHLLITLQFEAVEEKEKSLQNLQEKMNRLNDSVWHISKHLPKWDSEYGSFLAGSLPFFPGIFGRKTAPAPTRFSEEDNNSA